MKITGYQTNPLKKSYYNLLLKKNTELLKEGKTPDIWNSKNKMLFKQESLVQLKLDEIAFINSMKE